MSFINDQVPPVELFEDSLFFDDHFKRSDTDVPLTRHDGVTNNGSLSGKKKKKNIGMNGFANIKHSKRLEILEIKIDVSSRL